MSKKSKVVVIVLEDWQVEALKQLAEENGCVVNELINRVAREWLQRQPDYQPAPESQLVLF